MTGTTGFVDLSVRLARPDATFDHRPFSKAFDLGRNRLKGVRAVAPGDLDRINSFALTPLTADEIAVYEMHLANNQVDRDHERFHEDLLADFQETIIGKSLLIAHAWGPPGVGRFYKSRLAEEDGVLWLNTGFYLLKEGNETLVKNINAGIVWAASIGFFAPDRAMISGRNGEVLFAEYRRGPNGEPGEAIEGSLVFLGSQFDAAIVKGLQAQLGQMIRPTVKTTGFSPSPTDSVSDPIRWNRRLSKTFDVSTAGADPSRLEFSWISRYLDVEVQDVFEGGTFVPSARMGSFLSALEELLEGTHLDATRNLTLDDQEAPPQYDTIELNSKQSREFLVRGLRFFQSNLGRFVLKVVPEWYGLEIRTFASFEQRALVIELIDHVWARAKQLNFLKGEAFSLGGEFLPRTHEGWEELFLEPQNQMALQRAVALLQEKGAGLDSRGILLMGPPGTGKTMAGRVMMNEAPAATFIWVAARDFYRAGAFGGLAYAFDLAAECAPAIIFIEDIDSWLDAWSVDLLKTEMDDIRRRRGLLTVLTTNYPEQLPPALIDRPGRFHDVLQLALPTEELRGAMLRHWLPELAEPDVRALSTDTAQLSGAHLRELVAFARVLQAENDVTLVEAVRQALDKMRKQRELIAQVQQGQRYEPTKALLAEVERVKARIRQYECRLLGDGGNRTMEPTTKKGFLDAMSGLLDRFFGATASRIQRKATAAATGKSEKPHVPPTEDEDGQPTCPTGYRYNPDDGLCHLESKIEEEDAMEQKAIDELKTALTGLESQLANLTGTVNEVKAGLTPVAEQLTELEAAVKELAAAEEKILERVETIEAVFGQPKGRAVDGDESDLTKKGKGLFAGLIPKEYRSED